MGLCSSVDKANEAVERANLESKGAAIKEVKSVFELRLLVLRGIGPFAHTTHTHTTPLSQPSRQAPEIPSQG